MTKIEELMLRLSVMFEDDIVFFENPGYDSALIGITTDGICVYDYDLMVEDLVHTEGCDDEDAREVVDQTIQSFTYEEKHPIILTNIKRYI